MDESGARIWKPNSRKQEVFLSIPDEVFEGLYGGAAGGGKSEILMMIPLARGFIQHPRFKALFLRRTFPELEKEIIPRSYEFYSAAGGKYNDQKKVWDFSSGSRIFFGHLEHEQDVRKYDTAEFNYEAFDELTSFTEYQYTYLAATRCRSSNSLLPAIVRSATNPGNIGHGWVKNRWNIDKIKPGIIQRDKVTKNLKVFIQAFATDNPDLDPNYIQRLELLSSEAEKRAKKYGDWSVFEGQVFSEWRIMPLGDEPPNAQHIVSGMSLPDWWPRILAIDWGYRAYAYGLWGAVAPNKRTYVYREHAVKKEYIEKWISDIAYKSQGENIVDIVIDPSAKQNRGQPKTIFQQVQEALPENLGSLLRPADNDRIGGKALIHDFLRWTPRPQKFAVTETYDENTAQQILRVHGIEKYNTYLNYFREDEPEDPSMLPRLQVFEDCEVLINCIPQCIYSEVNKEDIKEFDGDDPYDTLRYLLKSVDNYTKQASDDFEKRKNLAAIVEKYEQTKDMQSYYMRMRKFEETERRQSSVAVPRYTRHTGRCPTLVQG